MSTRGRHILVIEDEVAISMSLEIRLKAAGYEVSCAEDTESGWRALEKRPDLVLCDLSMPGGGGLEVLERRQERADLAPIPMLILTAHDEAELEAEVLSRGAQGLVRKPFQSAQLLDEIADLLTGR